jgi:hypothetical protein
VKTPYKLLLVLGVLLAPAMLRAHDFSTSYAEIEVEGREVRVRLRMGLDEIHEGPAFDRDQDGRITADEVDAGGDLLYRTLSDNYGVRTPGALPVESWLESWEHDPETGLTEASLRYRFDLAVDDLRVESALDRITQADHRHLIRVGHQSQARFAILTREDPAITIDYAAGIPLYLTIYEFVMLGVGHIFTGYDHLAFLVALLVATTTLGSLARIVTWFTIAHSVTLALATLDVVTIPSRVIESLIALSIAWVAIENFMGRTLVHRRVVTLVFGLVHGFGFANVLRGMGLGGGQLAISLASFNVGVEIGQLLFVLALFPLLVGLSRYGWKEPAVSSASVAIMSLGFYWFFQRAFAF